MKLAPGPGPLLPNVTLGVYFSRSLNVVTLSRDSVSPVNAWIVSGTFCRLSLRRWAVTVISPISSAAPAAAASSAVSGAAAGAVAANAALPPSSPATAHDRR